MLAYRNQAGVESGEWYGLSCRIIGSTVINPYAVEKTPIQHITYVKTSWSTLKRKMASPPKKRNRERCSSVGSPSTAHGICILSTPSAKNARIRARISGLHLVRRARRRYRRAHCCNDVAHKAQLKLMTKLKNQREFTKTAYLGGENEGGLATGEGVDEGVTFGSART